MTSLGHFPVEIIFISVKKIHTSFNLILKNKYFKMLQALDGDFYLEEDTM